MNTTIEAPDILPFLRARRSTRAFAKKPIPQDTLKRLFEAARWAPSSSNEQPWRFIFAINGDPAFDYIAGTLMPINLDWARNAPVLILVCAALSRTNGSPNRHAYYDAGQAVGHLTVQALSEGLIQRQMGGFDLDAARAAVALPEGYDPIAVIAIGYPGDPMSLSESARERENAPRIRRRLNEIVFEGAFGEPAF
jgi:nitroreductase